jgi:hypothetical protein
VAHDDRFERELRELFESSGWDVHSHVNPEQDFDLIVEANGSRYAVEIKFAKEARRVLLEGVLASAILRARAAASVVAAKPLAVVCAPSISSSLLNELGDFVARFGEGVAWGAMDDSGLVVLHGPGLESVRRQRRFVRKPQPSAQRSDFLSDLGQWMLKVLFSHQLPPDLRVESRPELRDESPLERARIDEPIVNAMSLAKVAGVSVASASRFVASLKEDEYLVDDEGFLKIIRIDDLLDQWRAVLKRRPLELRARWLFPPKDSLKQLDEALKKARKSGDRACLGLFAACDRLGFRFVSGVAPHVYIEHPSNEALQRCGLRQAEPGEAADVMVREPRFPEAIFRGAMDRNGVPVADVLQCWLDVADNPARGEEMAAHLYERVIGPSLLPR